MSPAIGVSLAILIPIVAGAAFMLAGLLLAKLWRLIVSLWPTWVGIIVMAAVIVVMGRFWSSPRSPEMRTANFLDALNEHTARDRPHRQRAPAPPDGTRPRRRHRPRRRAGAPAEHADQIRALAAAMRNEKSKSPEDTPDV